MTKKIVELDKEIKEFESLKKVEKAIEQQMFAVYQHVADFIHIYGIAFVWVDGKQAVVSAVPPEENMLVACYKNVDNL